MIELDTQILKYILFDDFDLLHPFFELMKSYMLLRISDTDTQGELYEMLRNINWSMIRFIFFYSLWTDFVLVTQI